MGDVIDDLIYACSDKKKCNKNSQIGKRVSTFVESSSIFIKKSNGTFRYKFHSIVFKRHRYRKQYKSFSVMGFNSFWHKIICSEFCWDFSFAIDGWLHFVCARAHFCASYSYFILRYYLVPMCCALMFCHCKL